jgi:hypothetical protein
MSGKRLSWPALGAASACAALAAVVAALPPLVPSRAAEAAEKLYAKAPASVDLDKAAFLGVGSCQPCHEAPRKPYTTDYVQLTEYDTWATQDKHSDAYKVLLGERGREMGKALGWDVANDDRCLNCHCVNVKDENRRGQQYKREDGVSCDGCHGPAEHWYQKHVESNRWRYAAPEVKASWGMRDVRSPVERARLCCSCHVGKLAEGKWLTHEMYAAGHPPLPGIELATFSEDLPRHWYSLKKKAPAVQAELKKRFGLDPNELEQTRLVVLGGASALREAMTLLADQADPMSPYKAAAGGWPDFAQFDCYACHHELTRASWRQRRGTRGRPSAPDWPEALAPLSIAATAADPAETRRQLEEFHKRAGDLHLAFTARPFGDRERISAAARELAAWSDGRIAALHGVKFDAAAGERLLRRLCVLAQEGSPNYDAARQLGWGFERISSDVSLSREAGQQRDRILEALERDLALKVPSGKKQSIEAGLPARMKAMESYDPARFRALFGDLQRALKPAEGD